jgi:hypothetical protein
MKLKTALIAILILLVSTLHTFAQPLPCYGDDPDAACPLDTWVIALVVVASFFAVTRLYRRKKSIL